jgi:hypothetical protein
MVVLCICKVVQVVSENTASSVMGLLWFRRRRYDYATTFIEMILMVSLENVVSSNLSVIVIPRHDMVYSETGAFVHCNFILK